jgi:hypothetical protein
MQEVTSTSGIEHFINLNDMDVTKEIYASRLTAEPVQIMSLVEDPINFSSSKLLAEDLEEIFFIAMACEDIENMTTDSRGILIQSYRKVFDFLRELQKLCVVLDGKTPPPGLFPEGQGC